MTYLGAAPTTTASRKSQVTYRYLLTAGQSVISGADLNNNTLSCDPLDTEIFMNGLKLDSTDTTITATQVSLVTPGAAGDEIDVVAYRTFESADHYTKSTADARYEPIDSAYTKAEADTRYVNVTGDTMSGDLTVDTNTFHVDVADNRVGIGTSTPTKKLSIHESAAAGEGILLTNNHNVAGTYSDLKWQYSAADASYGSGLRFRQLNSSHGGQLEFYTDSATGTYTKQMEITENGHVTMPNQPAFNIIGNQNGYVSRITAGGTTNAIPFNTARGQGASGFNTSNGVFTASVAGSYLFTLYTLIASAGNHESYMYKNGSLYSRCYNYGGRTVSFSNVIPMAVNDYIVFGCDADAYLHSSTANYSSASIALLG